MPFFQLSKTIIFMRILFLPLAAFVSAADLNATLSNSPSGSNVPLRILPLGNSITFGLQSTDGNGYRKPLLDKITTNGPVQYIGSVRAGNMTDNYNEGHPGAIITQIATFSRLSLPFRPNLILLMAGTNDMNLNLSAGATERLGNLIDMCFTACPDAVILVAQLTPAETPYVEAQIEQFNPGVVSLVASREQQGMKILGVDMPKFVKIADLRDGLHPNDIGYAKMADAWFEGIQQAYSKGWFTPPVDGIGPPQDVGAVSAVSTITSFSVPRVSPTSSSFHVTTNSSALTAFASPTNSSLSTSQLSTSKFLLASSSASPTSSILAVSTLPATPPVPLASQTARSDANSISGWESSWKLSYFAFVGVWISLWKF